MSNWSDFQYTNHTADSQLNTRTNLYTLLIRNTVHSGAARVGRYVTITTLW